MQQARGVAKDQEVRQRLHGSGQDRGGGENPQGGQEGNREGKKGSDKGIDGVIAFIDDTTGKAKGPSPY